MYERFSGQARRAVYLAYEEAQRLKQEYVGSEHLLVGIVQEGSPSVAMLLAACGCDPQEIVKKVDYLLPHGVEPAELSKLPLTPSAMRVLEHAREEASALKHSWVAPEHFLLGLLREPDSTAAFVLTNLGLSLEKVQLQLAKLPPPENRDELLRAPRAVATSLDPSAHDLEAALSGKVLPNREVLWPEGTQQRRPQTHWFSKLPAEWARDLQTVERQLLALKIAVATFVGAMLGGLLGDWTGAVVGIFVGITVARHRNSILTATIGAVAGVFIGGALHFPLVAFIAGLVLGGCMGDWRTQGPPANRHTDRPPAP